MDEGGGRERERVEEESGRGKEEEGGKWVVLMSVYICTLLSSSQLFRKTPRFKLITLTDGPQTRRYQRQGATK